MSMKCGGNVSLNVLGVTETAWIISLFPPVKAEIKLSHD